MITVQPILAIKDNYIWAIVDDETKCVVIVDPGDAAPVIHFLEKNKLTLKGIMLTHKHWDHVDGVPELVAQYHVPVYGPENDHISTVTHPLREPDTFKIDGFPLTFSVIDIPGHTLGHIAIYTPSMLFSGDTLFSVGCGRLFEGTAEQMYHSLQKLKALPKETNVYCGHEYTLNNLRFAEAIDPDNMAIKERRIIVSALREEGKPTLPITLAEELMINLFLQCRSVDQFAMLRRKKDVFK